MEGLADRRAVAGPRGMVGDDKDSAGLESCVQFAVHLGATDRYVSGIVIEKEKCDEVQVVYVRGHRIIKRPRQADDVLARRRLQTRLKPRLRALAEFSGILAV